MTSMTAQAIGELLRDSFPNKQITFSPMVMVFKDGEIRCSCRLDIEGIGTIPIGSLNEGIATFHNMMARPTCGSASVMEFRNATAEQS